MVTQLGSVEPGFQFECHMCHSSSKALKPCTVREGLSHCWEPGVQSGFRSSSARYLLCDLR